jgi:ABC-2 type transport system ATP-binding protein
MPTSTDPAIQTKRLTKSYGKNLALNELSLAVSSKSIFGLLGPNGAGKSTAIKIMTTLLNATYGSAKVAGFDVASQPVEVRRNIGYVPQSLSADGTLTARENLKLLARLYDLRGDDMNNRINEALTFAGLEEVADKLVKTFSGGMVRRLEIVQATLHRPKVLFLDEPTIGLDPSARRTVWDRLLELRSSFGMTILISTHDMEEAEVLCDELAIIHQGRLVTSGSPQDLKAEVGSEASLSDVFVHFSGSSINQEGHSFNVREARDSVMRRG